MARNVAVIVGSLRKASLNRKMALALAKAAPPSLQLEIVEIGELAALQRGLDADPPAPWVAFRDRIRKRRGGALRDARVQPLGPRAS